MSKHHYKKTDGGPIPTQDARRRIEVYKKKHPNSNRAFYLGEDIVRKVIDNEEAVGMRVYLSYKDDGALDVVLVGTRADGTDIWPAEEGKDGPPNAVAADNSLPCPPYCP